MQAEQLLKEAIQHIALSRRSYSVLADQTLREIKDWCENAPSSQYQRNWRWIGRLRDAISYNAFWWLAHAGPFSSKEQQEWQLLVMQPESEDVQKQLETIVSQSRQRALAEAIAEQREPEFWYPAIPVEEVQSRIGCLHQLDADIRSSEPNEIIRDLYCGKIEEEMCFLRLVEAAYAKDRKRFWEMNQQLHPAPTRPRATLAVMRCKVRGRRHLGMIIQVTSSRKCTRISRFSCSSCSSRCWFGLFSVRAAKRGGDNTFFLIPAMNYPCFAPHDS